MHPSLKIKIMFEFSRKHGGFLLLSKEDLAKVHGKKKNKDCCK